MQLVNDQLNYFGIDDASECKSFALTLIGSTRVWFNDFPDGRIISWENFGNQFSAYFTTHKRWLVIGAALSEIIRGKKESLQSYIVWFMQVIVEVEGVREGLQCWIFENDLLRDHSFRLKIRRKKVKTTQEMLTMDESYMLLEEKLKMHFDILTSIETQSIHRDKKESRHYRDEFDRSMQGRYDKYTPLTISWENIY